jgi:hypothetical protein
MVRNNIQEHNCLWNELLKSCTDGTIQEQHVPFSQYNAQHNAMQCNANAM